MRTYVTFIDEAGNTGDNLQDLQQPLFVLAAVSVPKDALALAEQVRETHYLAVKEKEETEIKAAKWYKSPKKQEALATLLYEMKQLGAQYHVVVLEKCFMIAGWAVNTFFDYANVGSDDTSFVNDANKRKFVADHYEQNCTDEELSVIGQALRNPSREGYLQAINVLRRNAPEQSSKDILNCAESNIDNLLAEETRPSGTFSENVFHAPNLTSFATIGNMLAEMCKLEEAQTSIIFDDCTLCNQAFQQVFCIYSQIKEDFNIPTIPTHYRWKDRILSFSEAKSQAQPLLQAADALATCTDKLFHQKISIDDMVFTPIERSFVMLLALTFSENHLWMVTSQRFQQRFAKATRIACLEEDSFDNKDLSQQE